VWMNVTHGCHSTSTSTPSVPFSAFVDYPALDVYCRSAHCGITESYHPGAHKIETGQLFSTNLTESGRDQLKRHLICSLFFCNFVDIQTNRLSDSCQNLVCLSRPKPEARSPAAADPCVALPCSRRPIFISDQPCIGRSIDSNRSRSLLRMPSELL